MNNTVYDYIDFNEFNQIIDEEEYKRQEEQNAIKAAGLITKDNMSIFVDELLKRNLNLGVHLHDELSSILFLEGEYED